LQHGYKEASMNKTDYNRLVRLHESGVSSEVIIYAILDLCTSNVEAASVIMRLLDTSLLPHHLLEALGVIKNLLVSIAVGTSEDLIASKKTAQDFTDKIHNLLNNSSPTGK